VMKRDQKNLQNESEACFIACSGGFGEEAFVVGRRPWHFRGFYLRVAYRLPKAGQAGILPRQPVMPFIQGRLFDELKPPHV